MAKTFEQHCREARQDMAADGMYDMEDSTMYFDIAEAMLFDPEFKKMAKKRFPNVKSESVLRECVADSLYSA